MAWIVALGLGLTWWLRDPLDVRDLPSMRVIPPATASRLPSTAPPQEPGPAASPAATMPTHCGLQAWLPVAEAEITPVTVVRAVMKAGAQTRLDVLRALLADPDPQARAVGLFLATSEYVVQVPDLSRCQGMECIADTLAAAGSVLSHEWHAEKYVLPLAILARDTRSQAIYLMAIDACRRARSSDASGACAALTWERSTVLDPGSTLPWLHLAAQAQREGDLSGVENALRQALQADYLGGADEVVIRQVLSHTPSFAQGYPQVDAAHFAMLAAMGSSDLLYANPLALCNSNAVADANRRQTCAALADRLLGQSRSLMDLSIARAMGQASGLDSAVLDAARAEIDAAHTVQDPVTTMMKAVVSPGPSGCDRILDFRQRFEQWGEGGERALYRQKPSP